MNDTLELIPNWIGRNGTAAMTAKIGDEVILVEKFDATKSDDRAGFIRKLISKCPAIDADAVESELKTLAADHAAASKPKRTPNYHRHPTPRRCWRRCHNRSGIAPPKCWQVPI